MLLSINAAKPPDEGDISARPSPPASTKLTSKQPKQVLYSKVHQRPAKLHESLLHVSNSRSLPFSNSSSTDPADAQPVIIDTVYWGASQTPGSIFFDVTTRKESDRELYKLSFYQLQDFVGQLVHKSGSNRYLEINFDNNDAKQNACNNGLKFDNGHFVIRPAIALAPGSIVKRVNLHRLPWLRPKELLDGLKATLGNYGVVRDVGIIKDNDTGTFLGSGYAFLDVTPSLVPAGQPPFLELSHVITWIDEDINRSGNVFIHAYWNDMPVYCKYCHESGHNASSCPKSPSSKRVCFSCFKRGHVRADCPEKHKSAKRHRNGRVVSSASPASDTLLNINTESVDSSASVVSPASTQGPSSALVINTTVSTTTPTTVQVGQEVTPAVDQGKSILNSAGHDTATELDDLSHQSAANDVDMDGTSSESTIDYAPAVTRSPAPSPDITGSAATDPAFPDTVTNKTTATNGPNITGTRLVQTHSGRFSKPPSKWDL